MADERTCTCGRVLQAGENACPACRNEKAEFWGQVGKGALVVIGIVVWAARGFRGKLQGKGRAAGGRRAELR